MFLECASFTNGQTLKPNQTCISQQNFTSNEIEHSECKLNPPRQLDPTSGISRGRCLPNSPF